MPGTLGKCSPGPSIMADPSIIIWYTETAYHVWMWSLVENHSQMGDKNTPLPFQKGGGVMAHLFVKQEPEYPKTCKLCCMWKAFVRGAR